MQQLICTLTKKEELPREIASYCASILEAAAQLNAQKSEEVHSRVNFLYKRAQENISFLQLSSRLSLEQLKEPEVGFSIELKAEAGGGVILIINESKC